jgi:hypothetical protein
MTSQIPHLRHSKRGRRFQAGKGNFKPHYGYHVGDIIYSKEGDIYKIIDEEDKWWVIEVIETGDDNVLDLYPGEAGYISKEYLEGN